MLVIVLSVFYFCYHICLGLTRIPILDLHDFNSLILKTSLLRLMFMIVALSSPLQDWFHCCLMMAANA